MLLKQENTRDLTGLIGINDRNLAVIEQELNVSVIILGDEIRIQGSDEDRELAEKSIRCMMDLQHRGESLDPPRVRYIITLVREGSEDKAPELIKEPLEYEAIKVQTRNYKN